MLIKFIKHTIIGLGLFFITPQAVLAHGGFQRQAGDVTLYITQTPISPLVGETVEVVVVLKRSLNEPLVNVPVTVTLIDTFSGDATKDSVIKTSQYTTDENGVLQFAEKFDKENYFDVEFKFVDPKTNQESSTGFLIQPRAVPGATGQPDSTAKIILAAVAGGMVGIIGHRLMIRKRKQ